LAKPLGFLDRVAQAAELVDEPQAAGVFAEPAIRNCFIRYVLLLPFSPSGADSRETFATRAIAANLDPKNTNQYRSVAVRAHSKKIFSPFLFSSSFLGGKGREGRRGGGDAQVAWLHAGGQGRSYLTESELGWQVGTTSRHILCVLSHADCFERKDTRRRKENGGQRNGDHEWHAWELRVSLFVH
jgi:hypothetical protein